MSLVATVTLFFVLAVGAGPVSGVAAAATPQIGVWQAPVFVIPDAYRVDTESMQAISCASAGNCSAVGRFDGTLERNGSASDEGFVVSETDGVWGTAQEVADDNDDDYRFTAISCSSPGNCAAVGNDPGQGFGFAMNQTAGAWGAPQGIVGSASLSSVSCPSDGECTAAGSTGYGGRAMTVSESAGIWGTPEVLPGSLNTDAGLTSISCPSAGNCSVGGFYDAQPGGPLPDEGYPLVADETGGTWGSVQDLNGSFNDVADDEVDAVSSVSCSSAGNCSAGGYYGTYDGDRHAFVVSESDGTWAPVVEVAQSLDKSGSEIESLSCRTDGNCSAGGYYVDGDANPHAMVVDEVGGVWEPAQEVAGSLNVGEYAQITSVSCASAGNCSAAGYYANWAGGFVGLVATETDGSWDSGQDVATSPFSGDLGPDGLAQINSISCPSVDNCAAVGVLDDINDIQQAFVVAEIPENAQTITFNAPSQGTVTDSVVLTASASSGLPVALSVDASTTNDACTLLDGDTVVYQRAGTCVLDANQAGNAEFAAAPQVQQTIDIATGTVNGSSPLAPTAPSGRTVTLSVALPEEVLTSLGAPQTPSVDIAKAPHAVEEVVLVCTRQPLVLSDVLVDGSRVLLAGSADRSLHGRTVKIVFAGDHVVATARVGSNGLFSTTAPLPAADIRETNLARYQAVYGRMRSLDLKLTRRLQLQPPSVSGRTVTLVGEVVPP